ncbi:MAG: PAS domain S-box protein [Pseudomonas marincola]
MKNNSVYAASGYLSAEILVFLGVATIAGILIWKRATYSKRRAGFNYMVFGVTYIAIAVFLDYIIDTPAGELLLLLFSRETWRVLLQLGIYFPGSLCVGVGIFMWLPAVLRLEDEVVQHKKTEEALRKSEQKLLHHLENTPLACIFWDKNSVCTEWNRSAEKIFGFSADEAIGKNANNLIVPAEIHNDVDNLFESLLEMKGGHLSTNENLTKDGKTLICEWYNTTIVDMNEDVIGVASLVLDVTGRKNNEAKLHESEEYFRVAFQSNQGTATITDIETGKFIDVNAAWLRLRGFEKHEVIGKTSSELNTWGSNEHRNEVLGELKLHGKLRDYETYVITKAGKTREIVINAEVVKVSGKNLLFISGSDVTERNRLEKQLRSSQKLEAVGQLTGGVAHDFNNLMAIMMGNLELALEQVEPEAPLRNSIQNALEAVGRGAALTQHLLSFSRQQALSPAVTNVKQLVEGTLSFMERTLGEDIQIMASHVGEESRVNIDAAVFGNALVNLALNARDAMPDGGTLTVHTTAVMLTGETIGLDKEPTYGSHALITVTDTGSGMSEKNLEQVLEPFFTTKEVGKGSGLGLSMVYGFVTQSNGHISIASKEGEGTTISIYLPISDEEYIDKDTETTPPSDVKISKTILLVEDDQQVRATTSATLIILGCKVIEAEDGPSALEILKQRSSDIDLVLSDVVMPNGMSGIDLVKQIAIDHPHIKILLTSGYPDRIAGGDKIKAMDVELLAKPFRKSQLAAAIENA